MSEHLNLLEVAKACFEDDELGNDFMLKKPLNGELKLLSKFNEKNGTKCATLLEMSQINESGYNDVYAQILANRVSGP